MAERRMFARSVTNDDRFMNLSASAQALYMHLSMNADDDGFCNQVTIQMFRAHASIQDLEALVHAEFIYQFTSGVVLIRHWKICNRIQKDRYSPSLYEEERKQVYIDAGKAYTLDPVKAVKQLAEPAIAECSRNRAGMDTGGVRSESEVDTGCVRSESEMDTCCVRSGSKMDTGCVQNGSRMDTQYSIGKYSIGKDSTGKDSLEKKRSVKDRESEGKETGASRPGTQACQHPLSDVKQKKKFIKPTVEEIHAYEKEQGLSDQAVQFRDYYESCGWTVGRGKPMKDWQSARRTWERIDQERKPATAKKKEVYYRENVDTIWRGFNLPPLVKDGDGWKVQEDSGQTTKVS